MVHLEKKGNIAIITLDREKALNALNTEMLADFDAKISEVEADKDLRALIITGKGRSFVAGADIAEMSKLDIEGGREFALNGQRIFNRLEYMDIPTIAAVNGFAFGGGMELALSCDLRVASKTAQFGQLEITLGIMTGFAGSQRLPRLIGLGKAKEYIYTAKKFGADEALEVGLVNYVVDDAVEKAMEIAEQIAKQAPIAVKYSKYAINMGLATTNENGQRIESQLFGMCFATEDQTTGMSAFLNKEKAVFSGK